MKSKREQIIDLINEYIYTNGRQRITANQLNELLTLIANSFELLGQGTGGGINAVLTTDSNVDDNQKITNNNGGQVELSGKIDIDSEISVPYIGFLSSQEGIDIDGTNQSPKIGGVISNQWATVIGNIDGWNPLEPENGADFSPMIRGWLQNDNNASRLNRDSLSADDGAVRSAAAAIYLPNDISFGDLEAQRGVYTGLIQDDRMSFLRMGQDDLEISVRSEYATDKGTEKKKSSIDIQDYYISNEINDPIRFSREVLESTRKYIEFDGQEVLEVNNTGLKFNSGKRISYVSGSETAGIAVLTAGQVTVSTTAMSDYSYVMLTVQNEGVFQGNIRISSKTKSDFTISSSNDSDNCQVLWQIIDIL